MNWHIILYALAAALLAWYGIRTIRNNPDLFSKENMSQSFTTMGLLALGLIAFVALLIFLLKF